MKKKETIAEYTVRYAKRLKAGDDPATVEYDFRFNLGPTFVTVNPDGSLIGTEGLDNAWKHTLQIADEE